MEIQDCPNVAWLDDGFVSKIFLLPNVKELNDSPGVLYTKYDRLAVGVDTAKLIPLKSFESFIQSAEGLKVNIDINLTR